MAAIESNSGDLGAGLQNSSGIKAKSSKIWTGSSDFCAIGAGRHNFSAFEARSSSAGVDRGISGVVKNLNNIIVIKGIFIFPTTI
ncbi:hypothetical protein L484_019021 [Morus notabilis]|uniref:Uncharacterized protein n=1 Tax=Morus notabilis TaxID=981085 RepID=W9QUH3_9ROSA|nr:hypothetical protein L484_019021 [Morus notabilis]